MHWRAKMATVKQVLEIARKELGTMESPANSNNVKYNTWFYGRKVSGSSYPWCMAFVQWIFAQAGKKLPYTTASCSALLNWYRKNQPACGVNSPPPGDLGIYNFGHPGIVEAAGSGTITAIEGNTSPGSAGSQSNGGMVCRRTRKTSAVTAYIRPNCEKEEKPMDNNPSPAHKEAVEWARKHKILNGNAQGDWMLSQPVTRQQLCSILYNYHKIFGRS